MAWGYATVAGLEQEELMTRTNRIRHNKFGLAENPVGLHVKMTYKGRTLLGDVKATRRDELLGAIILTVHHFCGQPWPFEPGSYQVEVI